MEPLIIDEARVEEPDAAAEEAIEDIMEEAAIDVEAAMELPPEELTAAAQMALETDWTSVGNVSTIKYGVEE